MKCADDDGQRIELSSCQLVSWTWPLHDDDDYDYGIVMQYIRMLRNVHLCLSNRDRHTLGKSNWAKVG